MNFPFSAGKSFPGFRPKPVLSVPADGSHSQRHIHKPLYIWKKANSLGEEPCKAWTRAEVPSWSCTHNPLEHHTTLLGSSNGEHQGKALPCPPWPGRASRHKCTSGQCAHKGSFQPSGQFVPETLAPLWVLVLFPSGSLLQPGKPAKDGPSPRAAAPMGDTWKELLASMASWRVTHTHRGLAPSLLLELLWVRELPAPAQPPWGQGGSKMKHRSR